MAGPFSSKRAGDHKILFSISVVLTVMLFLLVSASEQAYLGGQTVQSSPTIALPNIVQSVNVWNGSDWSAGDIATSGNSIVVTFAAGVGTAKLIEVETANNTAEVNKLLHNNEVTFLVNVKATKGTVSGTGKAPVATLNSVDFELGSFLNGTTNLNKFSSKAIQDQILNTTIFGGSTNTLNQSQVATLMPLYGGSQTALPMLLIAGNFSAASGTSGNGTTSDTLTITLNLYKTSNLDLWQTLDLAFTGDAILMLVMLFIAYPRGHGL